MNVAQDLSFVALIANAHLIVKLIMLLLVGISVVSWTYIFRKMFAIRAARKQTEQFERSFWAGGNLHTLHQSASSQRDQSGALARIFESGRASSSRASRFRANRSTWAPCSTAHAAPCALPSSASSTLSMST
jgi:biopolymer transport protein TolQ